MLLSVWVSGYSIYSHCQLGTLTPVPVNHQIFLQESHSQPRLKYPPTEMFGLSHGQNSCWKRTSQVPVLTKHCHGHHRDGEYMGESSDNIWWWWYFEQTATVEEGGGVESRHGVGQINMRGGREKSHTIFMMEIIASLTLLPLTSNLKRQSKERHWTDQYLKNDRPGDDGTLRSV